MSIGDTVRPPAFSNGTEFETWQANWCDRCWHDRAARAGDYEDGCGLIVLGFMHEEVAAWVEADPPDRVRCLRFTPDDGRDDEGLPRPTPQIPGQRALFDLPDLFAVPAREVEVSP